MGNRDRGKKGRKIQKKEGEKFQLVGPFDRLEDNTYEHEYHHGQDAEISEISEEARKKIEEFKEEMENVIEQIDEGKAEKVEKLFKDGCAKYDASSGEKLLKKDAEGHHYHMNNPYTFKNGFEKHDIFKADGSVNKNSALFMTCYNSLADFGDVQIASHNEHDNKYSIYVKKSKK